MLFMPLARYFVRLLGILALALVAGGAAPLPQIGPKPWVTILCRFADHPGTPHPKSWYEEFLLGTNGPSLDSYFRENSYDHINLSGSVVVGWFNLPGTAASYVDVFGGPDREKLMRDAMNVADSTVFFPGFYGINVMLNGPLPGACYGGQFTGTNDAQVKFYGATFMQLICHNHASLAHEMGHGFGLDHSSGPYAPDEPDFGPHTYDSQWDTMSVGGNCSPGDPDYGCTAVHYNAYHKAQLGWITPEWIFVANPGTNTNVHLERLAHPDEFGFRMMHIVMPGWSTRYYTVEARMLEGYDGNGLPGECVVIHKIDTTRRDRQSQVIDGGVVPEGDDNPNDAAARWTLDEAFIDAANGITISIEGEIDTGYIVHIITEPSALRAGVVTSTADSGPGTLREAVHWANGNFGGTISFNLTNDTVIPLTRPLPDLTGMGVTIDGTTQPGFAGTPIVEICGTNVLDDSAGLWIFGNDNVVRGLSFTGFPLDALWVSGPFAINNRIENCYIGLRPDGSTVLPNGRTGVAVFGGAQDNIIGGASASQRNVISGNRGSGVYLGDSTTGGNRVRNNRIGLNAAGKAARGNEGEGVAVNGATDTRIERNVISGNTYRGIALTAGASLSEIKNNLIGTDADGAFSITNGFEGVALFDGAHHNLLGGLTYDGANFISGNAGSGIYLGGPDTSGNVVVGNFIGTDLLGAAALPNGGEGVVIVDGAHDNQIGGADFDEGNVISGNTLRGIFISDPATTRNFIFGNRIGTDLDGVVALANGYEGLAIANGAHHNQIGGAAFGQGNLISGNTFSGIFIGDAKTHSNVVEGNLIGTDLDGLADLGNGFDGIVILNGARQNRIGGTAAGAGNVLSGNGGRGLTLIGATNNLAQGNFIGTDSSGAIPLGNSLEGVALWGNAQNNFVGLALDGSGSGNIIAFNSNAGLAVFDTNTAGNTFRGNRAYNNGALSIDLVGGTENSFGVTLNDPGDLVAGPNHLRNFPVLTNATTAGAFTTLAGSLDSVANRDFLIDFYAGTNASASGHGPVQFYLGSLPVRTAANGRADFISGLPAGSATRHFTMTTTDLLTGDTSELGGNRVAIAATAGTPVITTAPVGLTSMIGATVNFSVTATGSGLLYQWRHAGTNLPGATAATLTLTNVQFTQAGGYAVVVRNASGFTASPVVLLDLMAAMPLLTGPLVLDATGFSIGLTLEVGRHYRVQFSQNLITWTDLTNFTAERMSTIIRDPAATNATRRFYRAVTP